MRLAIVSLSVQVDTFRVIDWLTGCSSAAAPASATARTMSRSERMPTMRLSALRTGTERIRLSARSGTADFRVAPGSMVTTSRPVAARIILTVISPSLGLAALPGVCDRPSGEVNSGNLRWLCTVPKLIGVVRAAVHHNQVRKIVGGCELNAWLRAHFGRRRSRIEGFE